MNVMERLISANTLISNRLSDYIAERNAMIERHATMIELALIDDIIRLCNERLSEIESYLIIGKIYYE